MRLTVLSSLWQVGTKFFASRLFLGYPNDQKRHPDLTEPLPSRTPMGWVSRSLLLHPGEPRRFMAKRFRKRSPDTCEAVDPSTNERICRRMIYDVTERKCVFHCQKKPVDVIRKAFLEELAAVTVDTSATAFDGRYGIFPDSLNLPNLVFEKPVDFKSAVFGCDTNLGGANFRAGVSFVFSRFGERAIFHQAVFSNKTSFNRATLGGGANFSGARFEQPSFFRTTFGDRANFSEARLGDRTVFVETAFGTGADFSQTIFSGTAKFSGASFGNDAGFTGTEFAGEVNFSRVQFGDGTTFRGGKFAAPASFSEARFGAKVSFSEARFDGEVSFYRTRFSREVEFLDSVIHEADFRCSLFCNPKLVVLDNLDLGKIRLVHSNLRDANFHHCTWPLIDGRTAVYDEIHCRDHHDEDTALEDIEEVYRGLQKNYECNLRDGESGNFYVGAMEMKRKRIAQHNGGTWRWLRQNVLSVAAMYRLTSFYGERYVRTLVWMLGAFLFFPCMYLVFGFQYPSTHSPESAYEVIKYQFPLSSTATYDIAGDYWKAVVVSTHSLTFQGAWPFKLTPESQMIFVTETFAGGILLALFLFALRRKFGR